MPTIKTEHEYDDLVNHPKHYTSSPATCECGRTIECIQITEHMSFTLGNAVKYIWRTDLKDGLKDLEKAVWYVTREIAKRRSQIDKAANQQTPRYSQGQQTKGDFESFKEYINEASSHNKGAQDTKRS